MEKQIIISISREYGSGGHEIAKQIAKDLGIKLYDKNILHEIADEKNIHIDYLKKHDEEPKRLLDSRRIGAYSNSIQDIVAEMQFEFIREKAESGESFLIVGRCAETVLKDYEDLISIFILGDLPFRVERVKAYENLNDSEALAKIKEVDKKRKQYHNRHSDGKWGDSRMYDVCIKSSSLGMEQTIRILEDYITARM